MSEFVFWARGAESLAFKSAYANYSSTTVDILVPIHMSDELILCFSQAQHWPNLLYLYHLQ